MSTDEFLLDAAERERDEARAERDAMRPVVEAARAWRAAIRLVEELQPGLLSRPGQALAAAVDALDGAS